MCSTMVIVDIIGLINNINSIPGTYEELEEIFVQKLLKS